MTILEVLVVLSIIAMVAAVVGPRLIGYLGRAKAETAALQVGQLRNSLQLFYIDMGRYPTASEGLSALAQAPSDAGDWKGPYIDNATAIVDPWGRDYLYDEGASAAVPIVTSLGRDGAKGGSGEDSDITG